MTTTIFEVPSEINEMTFERDSEIKKARNISLFIGKQDEGSRYIPLMFHCDLVSLRHILIDGGVVEFRTSPSEYNSREVITVRRHDNKLIVTGQFKSSGGDSSIIKVVTNTSAVEVLIKSLDAILENIERDGEIPMPLDIRRSLQY